MMLNARLFVSSFRKPYSLRIFESGEFMTHDGVSLFKGNCFDILPTLPSSSVQLFLCDLPYGVLNKQNPHASWDKPLDLNHLWYEIKRIGTTNKGFNEVLHHKASCKPTGFSPWVSEPIKNFACSRFQVFGI